MAVDELHSAQQSLLFTNGGDNTKNKIRKKGIFGLLAKWILKFIMWAIFVTWVAMFCVIPSDFGTDLYDDWLGATSGTLFGETGASLISILNITFMINCLKRLNETGFSGSALLLYSGPIIMIAFLAVPYLLLSGGDQQEEELQEKRPPRFRLWTFPVLVEGPFGVVSAAEFIGIILFVVFVLWGLYIHAVVNFELLPSPGDLPFKEMSCLIVEFLALGFGSIGSYLLAFLFIPIARGSVLLRLIGIPFEHATRYHAWLGHLTMLLFTLHGPFYVIAWAIKGHLIEEILEWKNLAGVIGLLAGLLMWVTSLHPVRKQKFELFFYTHQLYAVFVIFLAQHVGEFFFTIAAGGIFLFILDRFLRFCQSRRTVDIISAKCLPCGTVELILSKPASLRYNALSFIFLKVRELSWLQWHPFSVSSSPLDGNYHLSILIKAHGEWTTELQGNVLNSSDTELQKELHLQPQTKLTASVEGPYGNEQPYHLMYEDLILVAGGIGISPFLAILRDILHRTREGKACLPRNILIVWAVKRSKELSLLSTIDMESICPFFSDKLNLEIDIYVTRETEPPLEEGRVPEDTNSYTCSPVSHGCSMSVLVGTGNTFWSGLCVVSSTLGFLIIVGLMNVLYITPYSISARWYIGLLFFTCMPLSVFVFGGLVVGLWHLWERQNAMWEQCENDRTKVDKMPQNETVAHEDSRWQTLANATHTSYGSRPDFKEILGNISGKCGRVDVGVIVCGPPTLQSSIAKEIRSRNIRRQHNHPIFHFNSHSFDL